MPTMTPVQKIYRNAGNGGLHANNVHSNQQFRKWPTSTTPVNQRQRLTIRNNKYIEDECRSDAALFKSVVKPREELEVESPTCHQSLDWVTP